MGSLSIWHWIVVIGVAALLFGGRGKVSSLMGDFAKGIKAFKAGMKDEDEVTAPPAQVSPPGATTAPASAAAPASSVAAERPREHA